MNVPINHSRHIMERACSRLVCGKEFAMDQSSEEMLKELAMRQLYQRGSFFQRSASANLLYGCGFGS